MTRFQTTPDVHYDEVENFVSGKLVDADDEVATGPAHVVREPVPGGDGEPLDVIEGGGLRVGPVGRGGHRCSS